jgi:hypothetical protein
MARRQFLPFVRPHDPMLNMNEALESSLLALSSLMGLTVIEKLKTHLLLPFSPESRET